MQSSSTTTAIRNAAGNICAIHLGETDAPEHRGGIEGIRASLAMKADRNGFDREMPGPSHFHRATFFSGEGQRRIARTTGRVDIAFFAFGMDCRKWSNRHQEFVRKNLVGPGSGEVFSSAWSSSSLIVAAWQDERGIADLKAFAARIMEGDLALWLSVPERGLLRSHGLVVSCPTLTDDELQSRFGANAAIARQPASGSRATAMAKPAPMRERQRRIPGRRETA